LSRLFSYDGILPDLFREGQGIIAIGELTTAGGAGMPLAVKQIALPGFPLSLTLSDADTLRPGTSLLDFGQLDVSARISMTGVANATVGDLQAEKVRVDTHAITEITLQLDQRVP